jgi:hypothetical protein
MTMYRLTIDGRTFTVRDRRMLARLKRALVAAIRRGGDFVSIPMAPSSDVDVLVSPATSVRVERATLEEPVPDHEDAAPTELEFDEPVC